MSTDFGEVVYPPPSIQVTSATGAAVDADALPTWTVTLPDGTAGTPPTVQHGTVGEYWVNYVSPQAGRHEWLFSGLSGGLVLRKGGVFHVRPATPGPIVDLADVRRHLTIRDANAARDEQLADFLDAATELAEDFTGRVYRRQACVETYDGGRPSVVLRRAPVLSVTTVLESGVALLATDYTLDTQAGILYRGGSATFGLPWRWGRQNVSVAWVAGGTSVSARARLAVLELTRHLWDTQRGGSGLPRQSGADDSWDPRAGYAIPRRVIELLTPDVLPGSI